MGAPNSERRIIRFGVYECDLLAEELHKNGIKVKISYQPFHLLAILLARPGEVVTRQELRERLWPDQSFGGFDEGLNTAVKKLRAALDDEAENPRFIETLPRRGYRFIAPVESSGARRNTALTEAAQDAAEKAAGMGNALNSAHEASPAPPGLLLQRRHWMFGGLLLAAIAGGVLALSIWQAHERMATRAPIRTLAVLPFRDLSGNLPEDYFAEGVADELATELGLIRSVRVLSETSVMQIEGRGGDVPESLRRLGVEAYVEGTVVRDGRSVRLDARLIETSSGRNLWEQIFESGAKAVVGEEDELVHSAAEGIRRTLYPDQRTEFGRSQPVSDAAYEAYLHGLFSLDQRTAKSLQASAGYFSEATRMDPGFAAGYAELARSDSLLADYGILPDRLEEPKAEAAALRALKIDDSLGPAHLALAFGLWHYDWNWKAAKAEFQRAIALDPDDADVHHWYALFLASKGDFASAQEQISQARALDPLSLIIRTNVGWISYYRGDLSQAVADYKDALREDPSFLPAHQKLWIAYAKEGNHREALKELEVVLRANRQMEQGKRIQQLKIEALSFDDAVREYLNSLSGDDYEKARVFSIMGRKEEALHFLTEAAREREGWMVYIEVEPAFDSLRGLPQFERLLAEVHLPRGGSGR